MDYNRQATLYGEHSSGLSQFSNFFPPHTNS